ncbi:MAG: NAD-dependent epimerase/dehydratase family protein [Chitinophagaceae bacterium]|nr:NAD-dependent epimerase/dehydratase family protein [Chitinophagaceae bacterium]
MHTILGAGGPVGSSLTKVLSEAGEELRLVSRRKIQTSAPTSWVEADLKDFEQVKKAVQGSATIYMTAGLQYNKKIWATEWPLIMKNLINATKSTGARLIFFDNVYMYGHVEGPMTESTPYKPSSKKGEIRARIAEQLMSEAKAGNIKATIARAADFYGAESLNSFYDSMVLAKYAKKQKAMWLGNARTRHSFTYVPDTGKALYILAKDPQSDNQVWHLPTAPSLTGIEFIQLAARIFNTRPTYMQVNKFLLNTIGLFNNVIHEAAEMYYQYQYDYVFSSQKFEQAYDMKPTSYEEGIKYLSGTLFRQPPS